MSSIRNLSLTLALCLVGLGGCVRKAEMPAPAADRQTIAADDAMAKRNWPSSTSAYTNTSVEAGADRFAFEPSNPDHGVWLDTPLFVANSVVLPFTFIGTPPNTPVTATTGARLGPSYTAIPPAAGGSSGIAAEYDETIPKNRLAPAGGKAAK